MCLARVLRQLDSHLAEVLLKLARTSCGAEAGAGEGVDRFNRPSTMATSFFWRMVARVAFWSSVSSGASSS